MSLEGESVKDPDRSSHVEARLDTPGPPTAPTTPANISEALLAKPSLLWRRGDLPAGRLLRSSLLPKSTPRKTDHRTDSLAAGGTRGAGQRYSLK